MRKEAGARVAREVRGEFIERRWWKLVAGDQEREWLRAHLRTGLIQARGIEQVFCAGGVVVGV
jgi:hypothetical protein